MTPEITLEDRLFEVAVALRDTRRIREELDRAGVPTSTGGIVLSLAERVYLLIDRAIPERHNVDRRPQPAWYGEVECYAVHGDGLLCTRPQGHDGDHVAHERGGYVCRTWPQEVSP